MSSIDVPSSPTFDRSADGYDAVRRGLIPCFDAFYGMALDLIADWQGPDRPRVLDLGAGTGLFSAMLLSRIHDASIHLIDASSAMLERARLRFADNEAITYAVADMATANLAGPWDLVISALAIHHLEHDAKKQLFGRIHSAISPGGLFVNAEQVFGADPAIEAQYARIWLDQIRRLNVPADAITQAQERMAHDRCASVDDQLAWMREAGFSHVDCCFKAWRFAVLTGRVRVF
jgi:tRNA (cmo5U34)-methyltransferase